MGVVVVGMLTWWWPGFRTWGAMSAGVILSFVLWLLWRTVSADRTVPGHPIYFALAGPVLVLLYHLGRTGLGQTPVVPSELRGIVNMSLVFHLALLAGGVMVTQGLLADVRWRWVLPSVCGAAMMGGAAAALIWGGSFPARQALALLGFAGVAVWLSAPWSGDGREQSLSASRLSRVRALRLGYVGIAGIAAAGLATGSPGGAIAAAAVAGAAMLIAAAVFRRGRTMLLSAGAVLAAAVAALVFTVGIGLAGTHLASAGWFGKGEGVFAELSAANSGLVVLVGLTGWAGTAWLAGGFLVCGVLLVRRSAPRDAGQQARAILWLAASLLTGCAVLAPGGLFVPAVSLAAAFTWGMLPAMAGRPARRRSGVILLVLLVIVMALLGLTRMEGLACWSAEALGQEGGFLHALAGFLLALSLAWLMGARRVALGLVGIGLSAAAGAAGELLQDAFSARDAELRDLGFHLLGCVVAGVAYLLAIGCRECESPDAVARKVRLHDPYAY